MIFRSLAILFIFFLIILLVGYSLNKYLLYLYEKNRSAIAVDRNGNFLFIQPNKRGYFSFYDENFPSLIKELVLKKEDRFFYYHPGVNFFSTVEYLLAEIGIGGRQAQSTINQQLVKILMENEKDRRITNKLLELLLALNLDIFLSKEKILEMYLNMVYFGNNLQGITQASVAYFNKTPTFLTLEEIIQLLVTISNPNDNNPLKMNNIKLAKNFAERFNLTVDEKKFISWREARKNFNDFRRDNLFFDLKPFISDNPASSKLSFTIDRDINIAVKKIVRDNMKKLKLKNVKESAVIVLKLPENEVLAAVGISDISESEINMLFKPRMVGSTIKPFIYLLAFENGLRPYTLVEDREYKYISGLGFPYYPQNFDGKNYGIVSLHYALANSLNIPTLKILEFIGLEKFNDFLIRRLNFRPTQSLDSYQLTIALGTLEMSLFDLAKYFSIFPNEGLLKEIKILKDGPRSDLNPALISYPQYVSLVNKILSDRYTAVDQFSIKSNLNLPFKNYAVKTGTSNNFKDSWAVGYTPDFLVAVWVGNPDHSSMDKVSGTLGAGKIWAEVMNLMFNSVYNKNSNFNFGYLDEYSDGKNLEYGLENDNYEMIKYALLKDDNLVLSPFNNARYLLSNDAKIFLKARESVIWKVNGEIIGEGREEFFQPLTEGKYEIEATRDDKKEKLLIEVVKF
ncbi:MAG: transglycosylase domain-containing protein [Patescibacteria group bacterium]|nr:transglycosylase domain-containing protein [Patescibacteria group bacterium]